MAGQIVSAGEDSHERRNVKRGMQVAEDEFSVGSYAFDPVVNWCGYKNTMYISAAIQCVALIGRSEVLVREATPAHTEL